MQWASGGLPQEFQLDPNLEARGYAVAMSSVEATDATGPVEYYFACIDKPEYSSGWIGTNNYTTGIIGRSGQLLRFRVRARDALGNQTRWSATETSIPPGGAGR